MKNGDVVWREIGITRRIPSVPAPTISRSPPASMVVAGLVCTVAWWRRSGIGNARPENDAVGVKRDTTRSNAHARQAKARALPLPTCNPMPRAKSSVVCVISLAFSRSSSRLV